VCNAFFLVILMTMIYAIMGTTFIRMVDPANFGTFSISMYTMFRIMTFDNAAGITWGVMDMVEGYDKLLVALFAVSYQLIVAMILCNIVMAVLLDKFGEASEASKAEDAEEAIQALAERTVSALDPLLQQLSQVRSSTGPLHRHLHVEFHALMGCTARFSTESLLHVGILFLVR
jgi:voltage-gated sodium channel